MDHAPRSTTLRRPDAPGRGVVAWARQVNVILSPSTSVSFARAGMLSNDGRCKTFDARANGYVRAEGVGGLVLKAVTKSDVALELASNAVRQDGLSASLTAPNGVAQSRLVAAAIHEVRTAAPPQPTCRVWLPPHWPAAPRWPAPDLTWPHAHCTPPFRRLWSRPT